MVAGHGRHYLVEDDEGRRRLCHPRGKKSPCVVGDRVAWAPTTAGDSAEGVIEAVEPRRNLLFREDAFRTKAFASNVDQVVMLVAVEPPFSESQLARALIAAGAADIPACIVLNKIDLAGAAAASARLDPYRAIGVNVIEVALRKDPQAARSRLEPLLTGRVTLVIGPSGAGKSSLVNLMVPDAGAQVGEISRALNAGRHTTTVTQWYWLGDARATHHAALVDTPGFQEFGLRHVAPGDLAALMPDIGQRARECRFSDCTHEQEPGCAVRRAADQGSLSPTRLQLYRSLRAELAAPRY